jgi:agmatinase
MRRSLEYARLTQVGIRSLSTEEAEILPRLNTQIFYDVSMREDPGWIDRIVDTLAEEVYVTIDVDGLDPAIMPATGTPEPGGLSWAEVTRLLRTTAERRRVVAVDLVELSPIAGMVAPSFLCARLIYKVLSYCFAGDPRAHRLRPSVAHGEPAR